MPISYKNKIYTTLGTPTDLSGDVVSATDSAGVPAKDYTVKGKTIVWNQLFTNSATSSNGVTISNNQDGTMTLNGTANVSWINFTNLSDAMNQVHKYLLCLKILNNPDNVSFHYGWLNRGSMTTGIISNGESCSICNQTETMTQGGKYTGLAGLKTGTVFNSVKIVVMVMDLTQMFGAGNEPVTPAEFRAMFPDDYYPYNAGELKSIIPEAVETKNQYGETKRVNIPSSKYFPDGMRSAGSVYDEINFLSQKAIKRVGVRAYQAGDENNTGFITDKKNTVYALSTPVETVIAPPLQALSTYKGFTSFSAPNSLMQNGPLSVTYYAEGGTNPEKGWLTSYKRKLYMGRNIEWNQLLDKSKFRATVTSGGITVRNNGDGTFTINGTKEEGGGTTWIWFYNSTENVSLAKKLYGHKILYGCVQNPSSGPTNNTWGIDYEINNNMTNGAYTRSNLGESAVIATLNKVAASDITKAEFHFYFRPSSSGPAVYKDVVVRPQIFDLTQMFGAGNEPATPEEFWSYFDHKLYPYNTGETQPLFKISRKSQWGSATPASLYVGEDIIIPQIVRN